MGTWQVFLNKPKSVLCLHFSSSLQAGFFERKGDAWQVTALMQVPFSREAAPAALDAIRIFLQSQGNFSQTAMVASWKTDFLEKPVVLPQMPETEIRVAIKYAMEHHFSANLDEHLYAWVRSVEVAPAQGMKAHQYFVYAVPKAEAQFYTGLLKGLSLTLVSIVPAPIAAAEVLCLKEKEGKDFGVLDVDRETSTFQIYRGALPLLARGIPVGSRAFTERTPDQEEGSPQEDDPANRAQIEKLQSTMLASVDSYHQQAFAKDLGRIYLCGVGAKIQGLDRYLETTTEIPMTRPDIFPIDQLKIGPASVPKLEPNFPDYLPVLGSFLSWLGGGPNLLPAEAQFENETRAKSKLLRFAAASLAAVCLLVSAYFGLVLSLKFKEIRLLETRAVVAKDFEAFLARFGESKKLILAVGQGELPLVAFMKMLSLEVPAGCVLQEVDFTKSNRRLEIAGRIPAGGVNPAGTCAKLVQALGRFPRFTSAELVEGTTDPSGEYRFKISVRTL